VALLLDDALRDLLAGEVTRLRPLVHDVAWVARDNFHLTLKFLGGLDSTRLEAIVGALTGAAAGARPFDLAVAGLGAFPSPTRPRVLWIGIEQGAAEAASLATRVDDALAGVGFEREARAFTPHVTLGRARQARRQPGLAEVLRGGGVGRQRVERLSLMRSELSPRRARYTELAGVPLGLAPAGETDATPPRSG
jgi:RNA 2',3'-cyclic 3'-phosphodiesterase